MLAALALALPQQDAVLRVEGGYSEDLPLAAGAPIHVWAHMDPRVEVFLRWEGSGAEHLDAPSSWHAVFTVPAGEKREFSLRAKLARVEAAPLQLEYQGAAGPKTMDYLLPPEGEPRALAFYCHDADARRGGLFKIEAWNTALTLLHAGYAVAAINSEDADAGKPGPDGEMRWNGRDAELDANADMRNLAAAREALIAAGAIGADVPTYAFGQGNGGTFAASAAAVLGWRAAASYCGPGRKQLLEQKHVPVMWVMGTRDYIIRSGTDQARECKKMLEEAGVPVEIHYVEPSPLRAERLIERIGMDPDVATESVAKMSSTGVLDPRGLLLIPGITAWSRVEMEKLAYEDLHIWFAEDQSRVLEFRNQVDLLSGGHAMLADYAARMVEFFEERRGG